MASNQSILAHSYDIRIPVVAHHGPSKAPKLVARWIPPVAVATSPSPEIQLPEKNAWHLAGTQLEFVMRDGNAGNERFDWSNMYVE